MMPCYTPEPTEPEMNSWGDLSPRQAEAVLCAFAWAYGIDGIDYKKCGVEKSLVKKWWKEHLKRDMALERTRPPE